MLTSSQRSSITSDPINLSAIRDEALKTHREFTGNLLTVENNQYQRMAIVAKEVNINYHWYLCLAYFSYAFIFDYSFHLFLIVFLFIRFSIIIFAFTPFL